MIFETSFRNGSRNKKSKGGLSSTPTMVRSSISIFRTNGFEQAFFSLLEVESLVELAEN